MRKRAFFNTCAPRGCQMTLYKQSETQWGGEKGRAQEKEQAFYIRIKTRGQTLNKQYQQLPSTGQIHFNK